MMPFTDFLTTLAQALLVIALPIIIAAAIQTYRVQTQKLKSTVGDEKFGAIQSVVATAVQVAEQSGIIDKLAGPAKLDKAIQYVQAFLDKRGIHLDGTAITNLVEAEVHRQFGTSTSTVDTATAQQGLIDSAVESGVLAAEQSGLSGQIENSGQQKKSYALNMVKEYLAQHGINVPDELINGLIEAQVLRFTMAAHGQLPTAVPAPQPAQLPGARPAPPEAVG